MKKAKIIIPDMIGLLCKDKNAPAINNPKISERVEKTSLEANSTRGAKPLRLAGANISSRGFSVIV
jgi:hypothetical protein